MSGKEMTTERRLKARQLYATQLADVLGLSPNKLDEMKQAQRTKAIEEAVARLKSERTDAQILGREAFDVEIGGVTYPVRVLSFRESKAYRLRLDAALQSALKRLRVGGDVENVNLAEMIGPIVGWLQGEGMEEMVELMIAYCPSMAEARDAIWDAPQDEVEAAALRFLEFQLPLIKAALTQTMRLMGSAATTTAGAGR